MGYGKYDLEEDWLRRKYWEERLSQREIAKVTKCPRSAVQEAMKVMGIPRRKVGGEPTPLRELFWPKVQVGLHDQCWEWLSAKDKLGYGRFFYTTKNGRANDKAHRMAWRLTRGNIPDDMLVCHHCDHPWCVNPAHLFLGTNQDNVDDAVMKDRHAKGESSGRSVFSREDVMRIRREHKSGTSQMDLAREYDVSHTAIWCIVHRKTWQHLP